MTNPFTKPLLLVTLVLVLPLVLLASVGESYEPFVARLKSDPPSATTVFVSVAAILATDLVLPVPSGPISTLAGSQLGIVAGTLASTIGMTIGGVMAFTLARRWGRPLAERFAGAEQLEELETSASTHGIWLVLLTRPLPVLAEAGVLLVGTLQMSWRAFLPTLVISNLLISLTYAILGHYARERDWLVIAVCAAIALPVAAAFVAKRGIALKSR
jgi:3-dehydroquinate synthase